MATTKEVTIEAKVRTTLGKGNARKMRKAGKVPAVLNHAGKSTILELEPKLLSKAWKEGGKQFLMSLDGQTKKVKITELQLDPVRRLALHVDLTLAE